MHLQESSMDDLFIRYLEQLTKEYPYIQVNTDDSSTTISLGNETCIDEENGISQVTFEPKENYLVSVDFNEIITAFHNTHTTFKGVSNDRIQLETKIKLEQHSNNSCETSSSKLIEYLTTHARTCLSVLKVRHFYQSHQSVKVKADPVRIEKHNLTTATVRLSCNASYNGSESSGRIGEEFTTTILEIEHLNPEQFDVFILYEDENSITYEIINKKL